MIHTGAIPIGGDHFTNDVAVGFRTPIPDAEKIKKMFGCAMVTRIPEGNEIEVPSRGRSPVATDAAAHAGRNSGAARARADGTAARSSAPGRRLRTAGRRLVFTGGASRLHCAAGGAEDILRRPVRLGYPVPIAKLPSNLLEPEFSTAIGMVLYGHRARQAPHEH